jgi:hypothetical protein
MQRSGTGGLFDWFARRSIHAFTHPPTGVNDGFDLALDAVALARRINPREPVLANWLYGIGVAHLKSRRECAGDPSAE